MRADLVVVGSGPFGLTVTKRCATELGLDVVVLLSLSRRRKRLQRIRAGDRDGGLPVRRAPVPHLERARVGVRQQIHLVHGYQHRVYTTHRGEVFPLPINLGTINQFFRSAHPRRKPES